MIDKLYFAPLESHQQPWQSSYQVIMWYHQGLIIGKEGMQRTVIARTWQNKKKNELLILIDLVVSIPSMHAPYTKQETLNWYSTDKFRV